MEGSKCIHKGNKKDHWTPNFMPEKKKQKKHCLHLQLYRNSKDRCKNGPTKASLSLEKFLALTTGFRVENESNTMAIICKEVSITLAFDSRETLITWSVKLKNYFPKYFQFLVQMTALPPKSKLTCGPASLFVQDGLFSLIVGLPPRLAGVWNFSDLRRYGIAESKFCFEGGKRCGKGEGLHVLHTNQIEKLMNTFELASKGKLAEEQRSTGKRYSSSNWSRIPVKPECNHKHGGCESNESSQHLLSYSSSDGSFCDVCQEQIRLRSMVNVDLYGASTTEGFYCKCCCSSSCGHHSGESTKEEILASCPHLNPETQKNNNIETTATTTTTTNLVCEASLKRMSDSRCSFTVTLCVSCKTPHCAHKDPSNPSSRSHTPHSRVPHRAVSSGTISSLLSESTVVALRSCICHNSANPMIHNESFTARRCCTMGTLSDRTSLCSQSSQSSGTSSSSSSGNTSSKSSSEYSAPRTAHQAMIDMLYDKPKNLRLISTQSVEKSLNGSELNGHGCGCRSPQSNNCVSQQSSEVSITASPSKSCTNNGSVIENPSPEAYYKVPRTILPSEYVQELQNCVSQQNGGNKALPQETYDVPKKLKNFGSEPSNICGLLLNQAEISSRSQAGNQKGIGTNFDRSKTMNNIPSVNNKVLSPSTNSNQRNQWINGQQQQQQQQEQVRRTCALCLSSLESNQKTNSNQDGPESGDRKGHVINGSKSICDKLSSGTMQEVKEKTKMTKTTNSNPFSQSICQHNYVNIDFQKPQVERPNQRAYHEQQHPLNQTLHHNYENMHFAQSLSLYENMRPLNSGNESVTSKKSSGSKTEAKESNYELMSSFQEEMKPNCGNSSSDYGDYIEMQPMLKPEQPKGKGPTNSYGISFLPLLLAKLNQNPSLDKQQGLPNGGLARTRPGTPQRTQSPFRSGSFSDIKRKFLQRHRSNSSGDGSIPSLVSVSCPSSPRLLQRERQRKLSGKIIAMLRESVSTENIISLPTSVASTPRFNRSLESLSQDLFHHSADCLKIKRDDYRSSDEDLCTSSQITVLCASPRKLATLTKHRSIENSGKFISNICDNSANNVQQKSSGGSTSSSDMSDYIENNSLSSRTSSFGNIPDNSKRCHTIKAPQPVPVSREQCQRIQSPSPGCGTAT